jgi:hypothetical protein
MVHKNPLVSHVVQFFGLWDQAKFLFSNLPFILVHPLYNNIYFIARPKNFQSASRAKIYILYNIKKFQACPKKTPNKHLKNNPETSKTDPNLICSKQKV